MKQRSVKASVEVLATSAPIPPANKGNIDSFDSIPIGQFFGLVKSDGSVDDPGTPRVKISSDDYVSKTGRFTFKSLYKHSFENGVYTHVIPAFSVEVTF